MSQFLSFGVGAKGLNLPNSLVHNHSMNSEKVENGDFIEKEEKSGKSFDEIVSALESEPALFLGVG